MISLSPGDVELSLFIVVCSVGTQDRETDNRYAAEEFRCFTRGHIYRMVVSDKQAIQALHLGGYKGWD